MPDLISKAYHHVSPQFLLNAVSKARVAQSQIWHDTLSEEILGARRVESLSSILIAWVAVDGLVNETEFRVFAGRKANLAKGVQPTHENRLRACVAPSAADDIADKHEPTFLKFAEVRPSKTAVILVARERA